VVSRGRSSRGRRRTRARRAPAVDR